MSQIHALFAVIVVQLRARLATLRLAPERGAGGHSLETVLLAIGGVLATAVVIAGIAAVIRGHVGDLNP